MINYNKLSDFEINKRVAKTLNKYTPLNYPHEADKRSVGSLCSNDDYRWYDYCNNPADAWSIIIQNKINIAFDCNENEWMAWGNFEFDHCGWDMINEPSIYNSHENALRAAMTVFLMMQENKQ